MLDWATLGGFVWVGMLIWAVLGIALIVLSIVGVADRAKSGELRPAGRQLAPGHGDGQERCSRP